MNGQNREDVKIGSQVEIVLKEDQKVKENGVNPDFITSMASRQRRLNLI